MFKEIVKNVWVINANSYENNTYIIVKNKECIIIDPSSYYDEIVKFIEEKHLKLLAIILTHAHFDHYGISNDLAEKFGVKIYVHENEKPQFDLFYIDLFAEPAKKAKFPMSKVDWNNIKLFNDRNLRFNDIDIDVIRTPGHTLGGVVLIYDKNKFFTGDTMFTDGVGVSNLPGSNINMILNSLYKLSQVLRDDDYILCGHYQKYCLYKDVKAKNVYVQQVLSSDIKKK